MNSVYVSRINQLDALQLDEEIYRILQCRAQEIGKLFTPEIIELWSPEINGALRAIIWIFSLGRDKSTFGQRLLDLTYANLTRKKAILILFISVTSKYIEDKYMNPNTLAINNTAKVMKKYLDKLMSVIQLFSIINLLLFLHRGYQPTLLERIINIYSCNITVNKPRSIGYSYITRELLWHGLMELFTIGLPMINFHYLKCYCYKFWLKSTKINDNSIIPMMTIDTLCPYCNESPILPRHAGCTHIYCYYCMMAHFTATESFNCILCETELHSRDMKIYLSLS